ncbi:hypothetical protein DH2020_025704 [Rehmannia glutinosa]|uniref:DC1 domain-containing protein n=1 Tax=Rehmannia glutinosa TaxID=99300 RepID=A0ABR0W2X5_REHGL
MGRITSEPQKETTTTHFSHPHPLKLIPYHHHQHTVNLACSGCNLKPSGTIYSCTTCNYFLHKKCFEMPKKITHPFHKEHSFTLLPEPAYAEGLFNCDACGERGKGFSYHCKPCGMDLHILCAAMPLTLTSICHTHVLNLTFDSPYVTKNFCCDICKSPGSNHWLYRCNLCGFDAHLNCARDAPTNMMGFQPQQAAAVCSRSALPPRPQGFAAAPFPMKQGNMAVGVPAGGPIMPNFGVNGQNNELFIQAFQQTVNNQNAMVQAILAGRGGGGFGGDRGLQQLMQMISGLNNSGVGGGGVPGLNGFGAGGQEFLQGLMSGGGGGGGGGGLDLQSLLGGGNGLDILGGGGLDFLGGALGGGGVLDFLGGALGGFSL